MPNIDFQCRVRIQKVKSHPSFPDDNIFLKKHSRLLATPVFAKEIVDNATIPLR